MSETKGSGEFKVSDRRRFSSDGEPLDSGAEKEQRPPGGEAGQQRAAEGSQAERRERPRASRQEPPRPAPSPPPAKFEILVLSLALQAEAELGLTGELEGRAPNLELAQHTIDLLGVLQQKTKGNLTLEEQRMLENTLTELRFRYVQRVEEITQQAKS